MPVSPTELCALPLRLTPAESSPPGGMHGAHHRVVTEYDDAKESHGQRSSSSGGAAHTDGRDDEHSRHMRRAHRHRRHRDDDAAKAHGLKVDAAETAEEASQHNSLWSSSWLVDSSSSSSKEKAMLASNARTALPADRELIPLQSHGRGAVSIATTATTADSSVLSPSAVDTVAAESPPLSLLTFVPSLGIVFPAMLSGASQAVIFNPVDRALYLRVIMRRSLFHVDNWRNPFQGFANAGFHRMVSAGGYLCWQEVMRRAIVGRLNNEVVERFSVGLVAGSVMGCSLNGLQFVKYRLWTEGTGGFWRLVRRLHAEAGFRIFFRGTKVSIMRDSVFGLTYEVLRGSRNKDDPSKNFASHHFLRDTAAGSVACWTSAPINYCRNIIYGVPPRSCPLSVTRLLHNLYTESMCGGTTFLQRWNIMNSRLNLGWAAMRVGLGVAVGQNLFEFYKYQYWLLSHKASKK